MSKRIKRLKKLARKLIKQRRFHIVTAGLAAIALSYFGYYILSSRAAVTPSSFGINVGWTWNTCPDNTTSSCAALDAEFNDLSALGVKWVRADFPWSEVQAGGPNSYDWARDDRLVNTARAHGMNVLGILDYSPPWAALNHSTDDHTQPDPSEFGAYANYAKQAASRYNGRVSAWEIWNEPNTPAFWKPAPSASAYTSLLKQAYPAIKSVSSASVLSAGPAPCCNAGDTLGITPPNFLSGIYANGGHGYFDVVGWHPYTDDNEPPTTNQSWSSWWQMFGTTPSARSLMSANGDGGKQIWPTEFGFSSHGSGSSGETNQATWLKEAYNLFGSYSWAGPAFWYEWKDEAAYSANVNKEQYFGLNRIDGSKKPAWTAYQQLATSVAPDTSPPTNVRIALPPSGATVSGPSVGFSAGADDDRGVTKVEYYRGSTFLGNGNLTGYGWLLTWNSTSVADGSYAFTVKAYDAAGHVTTSAPTNLNVKNNTTVVGSGGTGSGSSGSSGSGSGGSALVKTVTIGGGASGSVPSVTGDVDLLPAITNPAAVLKVEYYLDGKLIYTSQGGDFGYNLDTTKIKNGRHVVMTKIYNKDGSVTVKSQTISVHNATAPLDWWWLIVILPIPGYILVTWWRERLGLFGRPPKAIRRRLGVK